MVAAAKAHRPNKTSSLTHAGGRVRLGVPAGRSRGWAQQASQRLAVPQCSVGAASRSNLQWAAIRAICHHQVYGVPSIGTTP